MGEAVRARSAFTEGYCWLSGVAGFVDAACFLGLSSVFTAHVTGNIAALASAFAKPSPETLLRLNVLFSFGAGVVLCCLAARRARPCVRRLVLLQLEATPLALLVLVQPLFVGTPLMRVAVATLAGAAMGCQAALNKTGAFARQPTTVMTSNFTHWVALFVLPADPEQPPSERREAHLRLTCCLAAFCAGAALGALLGNVPKTVEGWDGGCGID